MDSWHAICIRYGNEVEANSYLRTTVGIETFFPTRQRVQIRRGRRTEHTVPHLDRYVLAKFDNTDARLWHEIAAAPGFVTFLGGEYPWVISDHHLAVFRKQFSGERIIMTDEVRRALLGWGVGDLVEFSYGAFHNYVGEVEVLDDLAAGVKITLLGRPQRVYVPVTSVLRSFGRASDGIINDVAASGRQTNDRARALSLATQSRRSLKRRLRSAKLLKHALHQRQESA